MARLPLFASAADAGRRKSGARWRKRNGAVTDRAYLLPRGDCEWSKIMFFRSERLFLRPGWPEDYTELFSQIDDWAVIAHLMSMAESAQRRVAAYADVPLRRFPQFVVTLPGGDGAHLIGSVSLLSGEHGGELFYWIAPEFSGHGYATEAVAAVLGLARTLGHRQIAALDLAGNAASARVLAKSGFQVTGDTGLRMCRARGVLTAPRVHRRDLGDQGDRDSSCARQAA